MTPINFSLVKKNGSLHLSGIRFCDFSTLSIYIHIKKTGLDSVVLKVCNFFFTNVSFGVNMTPIENEWEMRKNTFFFFICQKKNQ